MEVKGGMLYLAITVILSCQAISMQSAEQTTNNKEYLFTRQTFFTGILLREAASVSNSVTCANLCHTKSTECTAVAYRKESRKCQLIAVDPKGNTSFPASSEWKLFVVKSICPLGWEFINSACYYHAAVEMNWEGARQHCQSKSGTLAAITSVEENAAILSWLAAKSAPFFAWIGGSDIIVDGTWKWETGEAFVFQGWSNGEPNGNGSENCLTILSVTGGWTDYDCSLTLSHSVCEKDPY